MKHGLIGFLFGMVVFLAGCGDNPEDYTREKALEAARPHLVEYAQEHQVPLSEFKGPYFAKTLGLDFPTYIVCYKHPVHFFCYDHWIGDVYAYPRGEHQPELMKWLDKQPNETPHTDTFF